MNKSNNIYFLFLIISVFSISSCYNSSSDIKSYKQNCTGAMGEVVVVMEDTKWEGALGDSVFYYFSQDHPCFLQQEPILDVAHINHAAFSSIFKTHRNIVITHINPEYTEPEVTIEKDKWAAPQIVFNINAQDEKSFLELFNKSKQKIRDSIVSQEIRRYQNVCKQYNVEDISTKLKEKYNFNLTVPTGYTLDVATDSFVWISYETPRTSQGILIYFYEYEHKNTFTEEYLVSKRDSVLKYNVPGPAEGSYMSTEKKLPVLLTEYSLNDLYVCELRGLWRTEGAFLGGPFISISQVDEKRNRVITVEGYVYAGKQDKKIYFWQIESIIKSFKIL